MRKSLWLGLCALGCVLAGTACEEDDDMEHVILRAALTPLNSPLKNISGTAEVENAIGLLTADVNITGLDSVTHIQFIGNGNRCPSVSDDTNGDGNIDIREGMVAFGDVLLALDSTLAINEASLSGEFPFGTAYAYTESDAFATVENSLRPAPGNDFMASVSVGQSFDPEGMPVVVLGVAGILPRTVATLPGFAETETLPVACGVLVRVDNDDD